MYCTKTITKDLFWVGGNDRRLALFENIYPIPRGVSYNAYLLLDEKTVLLDTVDRVARQNGEPLDLRRREFDLLELLMRNRGAALYRDVIFERVWGELPDTESLRTVDTHIARLRKKLGWTDKQIETVFKIGYRLRKE